MAKRKPQNGEKAANQYGSWWNRLLATSAKDVGMPLCLDDQYKEYLYTSVTNHNKAAVRGWSVSQSRSTPVSHIG